MQCVGNAIIIKDVQEVLLLITATKIKQITKQSVNRPSLKKLLLLSTVIRVTIVLYIRSVVSVSSCER